METCLKSSNNLEDDGAASFASSGGGVKKAKLFCKFTDATVLVTAEVLLLSSSIDDLLPRMLHPKGDGSVGLLDDSRVTLFASVSMYF